MIRFFVLQLLLLFLVEPCFSQLKINIDSLEQDYEVFTPNKFDTISFRAYDLYLRGEYGASFRLSLLNLERVLKTDNTRYIASAYKTMAYKHMTFSDTLIAKDYFDKARHFAEKGNHKSHMANSLMGLANYHQYVRDFEKSSAYFEEATVAYQELNDSVSLAWNYINSLTTYFELGDYEKALTNIDKASQLKHLVTYPSFETELQIKYAETYLNLEKPELAKLYAYQGLAMTEDKNMPLELEMLYPVLANIASMEGAHAEAYKFMQLLDSVKTINEKIKNEEEANIIFAKYQVAQFKEEAENARINEELASQLAESKSNSNTFIIGLFALSILALILLLWAFRKRAKLNKALQIKNAEYLKAKEQSEKLAAAKSNFFSTVSHELRTPLYGVIGLSTILLENEKLNEHEEDLKTLKFSADYLLSLINDVLQINKIDSDNIDLKEVPFNIRKLIQQIISSCEYIRLQHQNELKLSIHKDVPRSLIGNTYILSQVLMNLIGNACKFTENGTITVSVVPVKSAIEGCTLRIAVADTGIGIAKAKQKSIFEEFSQVEPSDYQYQGTGLGLPIVRKLLALEESDISLESTLGQGSTFYFDISYPIDDQAVTKEIISTTNKLDNSILKDTTILVAEDNRINQMVTKKILERYDINCHLVSNGKEAVASVKQMSFDLVLMDLNMPVMNGFESAKAIREIHPSLPIIALTAVEVDEVRIEIYQAGMNDIVVKPYDANQFIKTLVQNLTEGPISKDKREAM